MSESCNSSVETRPARLKLAWFLFAPAFLLLFLERDIQRSIAYYSGSGAFHYKWILLSGLLIPFIPSLVFLGSVELAYMVGETRVNRFVTLVVAVVLFAVAFFFRIPASETDANFLAGFSKAFSPIVQNELLSWYQDVNAHELNSTTNQLQDLDRASLPIAVRALHPSVRPDVFYSSAGSNNFLVISWGGPYFRWAVCYLRGTDFEPYDALQSIETSTDFVIYTRK